MKKRSRLRVLRAAAEPRLSQARLARKIGVGTFRYWQIENGDGPPVSPTEQERIAAALGVKVADIEWPAREDLAEAS